MKQLLILLLTGVIVLSMACVTETKNALEGTWEMIEARWSRTDTTFTFPATQFERQVKILDKTHFVFVRQDTSVEDSYFYGGGIYTLVGDTYTETLEFFGNKSAVGQTFTFKIQINGDTLKQTGQLPYKTLGIGDYDVELYEVWKRIE